MNTVGSRKFRKQWKVFHVILFRKPWKVFFIKKFRKRIRTRLQLFSSAVREPLGIMAKKLRDPLKPISKILPKFSVETYKTSLNKCKIYATFTTYLYEFEPLDNINDTYYITRYAYVMQGNRPFIRHQ